MKAPFPGIAVHPDTTDGSKAIFVQPGIQVSQGKPLLTVIGIDRLQVLTQVSESDLYQLRVGMPVKITGDGFTGSVLEGHIAAISVQSNASDSYGGAARYDVVAAIDTLPSDSAQQIRLGMSARVVVILYRNEKAIVVPPQAIHGEGDIAWVCYRKTLDTETIKQHVKIGNTVSQGVEILGIEAGYVMIP
ncbi:HlyD family efflux transporter periplasmic adaptor subunit (plasmid) [Rahnella aquatilis]|uniref:HlyD family efflux transporter periplasmic adaptor subunit n=1 Tax=Rahnella perminowiae TaxID=2816244 RepID=A0ABS6KZQ0_9GAMM|nr:HlyD family efflux transporter periplasmic adaptor subunit [Rahnella perminowiae]UJD92611.1 HlyD family efflux transporter periplasmic adaptor subunit [Rahnella aquatilis]